eukprot:1149214-Pelagomonas_calceolata.AAC.5
MQKTGNSEPQGEKAEGTCKAKHHTVQPRHLHTGVEIAMQTPFISDNASCKPCPPPADSGGQELNAAGRGSAAHRVRGLLPVASRCALEDVLWCCLSEKTAPGCVQGVKRI